MQLSRLSTCVIIGILLGELSVAHADWNYCTKKSDGVSYSFLIIPDLPDTSDTFPYGINDRGQLAGTYQDSLFFSHGFFLNRGSFKPIDFPGEVRQTVFTGLNSHGKIVGFYADTGFGEHGFLLDGGVFTTVDFPGLANTELWGINDRGQMVGFVQLHGFLLDRGVFKLIDAPGADNGTYPFGINNRGQIVGTAVRISTEPKQQGFVLDARGFTIISVPDAGNVQARGINDNGQIVGLYQDSSGHTHGFLLDRGVVTQIDAPGASNTSVLGINNQGQIVGFSSNSSGFFGFVASPVHNEFRHR